MATYSVAEARDRLSRLISEAEAGEHVVITRHGKPAAEVRAVAKGKAELEPWADRLARLRASMPRLPMTAVELVRLDRDGSEL